MWRKARLTAATLVTVVTPLCLSSAAWASRPHSYATDQLALSYEIPITNPADGLTYPSVLLVSGARLDSQMPDGSGVSAPDGELYLTLQMSSGPVQHNFGDPSYGDFFSNMTPLPASAFECRSNKGHVYQVTRSDPADESVTANADTADGLVAATYACLVPENFRTGSVVINPTSTIGTEYQNMTGGSPTVLHVGGPTTIPVQFPAQLTVESPPTTQGPANGSPPSGSSSSSSGLLGGVLLVVVIGGATTYFLRRRPQATAPSDSKQEGSTPREDTVIPATPPTPPTTVDPSDLQAPTDAATTNDVVDAGATSGVGPIDPSHGLSIKVLGGVEFEPPLYGLSDGARAVLCFLAFHRDRPISAGELQTALWPLSKTQRDVSPRTLQNYVSEARRAVGPEVLPETKRGAGYHLESTSTDFDEFTRLVRASMAAEPGESRRLRRQALALVREHPFASEYSDFFDWSRRDGIERQMVLSISEVALRTGTELLGEGDLDDALDVLSRGLLASPAWLPLWEVLTDVVVARSNSAELAEHWHHAEANLTDSELDTLRQRASL